MGVSKDRAKSHQKFKQKYELPFVLLSDPEGKVLQLYVCGRRKVFPVEHLWTRSEPLF